MPAQTVVDVYSFHKIGGAKGIFGWLARSLGIVVLAALMPVAASAQVSVTTHHYDVGRTGADTAETILTPTNVNSTTFGQLFTVAVDGQLYAQPLYMPNVTIPGKGVHNVVYVASEHDSVYAFDADTGGTALWHDSFLINGATTVDWSVVNVKDIYPENGITGTPVIDPTTNTLYVVVLTYENSLCVHRLHALDITTGAEKFGGPVQIAASTPGTGDGSSNGTVTFNSIYENQRPGLLLLNGFVYVGFAAFGDNGEWHGWVLSYNAATLALAGQFCASPNGEGSGFWAAGNGLSADTSTGGRLFVTTGNGDFPVEGNVIAKGAAAPQPSTSVDYGDSIIQLTITNGALAPTDYFTPYNTASLDGADTDLGAGGTLILPDQAGTYPHELIQVGKQGHIYVINRDKMTNDNSHFCNGCSTDPEILQTVTGIDGLWSMPAYWNGNVYFWGNGDSLKMYPITNGVLAAAPTSQSAETSGFPGSTPVISANGTTNGIAWTNESDGYLHDPAILRAYNATNVSQLLWASNLQTTDTPGQAVKFTLPMVANGKVYLGTYNQLDVYGLKGTVATAATPTFSPVAGSYATAQSVTISDSTAGATIYCTNDGSTPTTASPVCSAPISVTTSTKINAIASAGGYLTSGVGTALYTIAGKPVAPVLSPAPGSYTGTQSVTITDATAGSTIYITYDGSTPTQGSTKYTGAITVKSTETLRAMAAIAGVGNSPTAGGVYTITPASNLAIDYSLGFATPAGLQFNGSTGLDDSRLQLTNGEPNEAGSAFYTTPVDIRNFTTDFSIQISDAVADGMTFTIQNSAAGAKALGLLGGNLGYGGGASGIGNSVAIKFDFYSNSGEGTDSTGLYQNGASPILPSIDMTSSGLSLLSGDAIQAHITYDGTTLAMTLTDAVTNKTFSQSWTVNIPTVIGSNTAYIGFTGGAGGSSSSQKVETWSLTSTPPGASVAATPVIAPGTETFNGTVSVSITDATTGSAIYYTTDGSNPAPATGTTQQYSAPLTVVATTTVKALATATTYTNSAVAIATYTLSQTATPTFSPAGGNYSGTLHVVISCTTPNAAIYYTTDKSVPVPGGATTHTYPAGGFPLAKSYTVNAIAIAPGYSNSAMATTVYTAVAGGSGGITGYSSGFTTTAGLQLNGGAAINTAANALAITSGANQAGSFFATTLVNVQSFTNTFSFKLPAPLSNGITFTIQSNGTTGVGGTGGALGYSVLSSQTAPFSKSVALKFDVYSNSGEGIDSTGIYVNGAPPLVPAVDMTNSGVKLTGGDTFNVTMLYDGTWLKMTITDATTSQTFTDAWPVNIPAAVGGNTAYVGFTAGTGGTASTQEILNWNYTPGTPTMKDGTEFIAANLLSASVSSGPAYQEIAWTQFATGEGTMLSSVNVGDNVAITVTVPAAGTYDVRFATKLHNQNGMGQLSIGGVNVGTPMDQYAASDTWYETDLGNVTLAAGTQTMQLALTGENAASTGTGLILDYIKLLPQ